ncbi:hypothetical protein LOZ39_005705 [Ophidiomyces ophidiicola]|uniref:Uncharacterized protein n=1 Tax=Ophidiomyces ophidiicola TaxID=1387563 RepID=A0ACB8UPN4_9EURO|nr:hypothetical protein LOZ62_004518 [Ophidiomyces ophidiicola]KAI1968644.1 hypothetical protein LOZ56_004962 [Ophidiomyces ophidiicola]KAI1988439.1 hypothetical protein LOZ54_003207 [Ophidiomyces ophidiicola]KAI2000463.1 hypothetical protein LOZ50_005934 [Ophidiomyces ophidiicola]KAI2002275.1 hypothetical protein LOZ49_006374 [Ophidiomyces ophidiicola]
MIRPTPASALRLLTSSSRFPTASAVTSRSTLFSRAMASNAAQKPDWIVVVHDRKDSTLERRMAARDQHIGNLGPLIDSGLLKMGGSIRGVPLTDCPSGAILKNHPKEGEAPPMNGSALVVSADTEEEIREALSNDIYAKTGVWDLNNIEIYPFRCALNTYANPKK